jgi:hypothetical protein
MVTISSKYRLQLIISRGIHGYLLPRTEPYKNGSYKFCRISDYNSEARVLYQQDKSRYEEKALEMVRNYPCPRPNSSTNPLLKMMIQQMIHKHFHLGLVNINQLTLPKYSETVVSFVIEYMETQYVSFNYCKLDVLERKQLFRCSCVCRDLLRINKILNNSILY